MKNLIFTICCAVSLFVNADNIFISQNEYYKSDMYKTNDNKLRVGDMINLSFEYVYVNDEILFKTNNEDIYKSICSMGKYYNIFKVNNEFIAMTLQGCYDDGYVVFNTSEYVLEQFKTQKKVYILFNKDVVTYFVGFKK